MAEPLIDPNAVNEAFRDCLFRDDEITDQTKPPEGAVVVEGIVSTFALHPERLESHRSEVATWLGDLPDEFQQSKGGGWSFLNGCTDRNGALWTGLQRTVGELFTMGEGLGLVKCQMPREMWSVLPGGVPYYSVLDEAIV